MIRTISREGMMNIDNLVKAYNSGLTIKEIAKIYNVSYEYVRKNIKGKVNWRRRYISDFSKQEVSDIISLFDKNITVEEIAKRYRISAPAISRLLKANNRTPICSSRKYDILRQTPFNNTHKDIIIGMMLGDGCIYRDGKNSLYKLSFGHKEEHSEYFHWLVAMMDPFINTWRRSVDKRKNSIMLQTATICHKEFSRYANMFYDDQRIKHVPKDIENYMTPMALAIWVCDDGNLKNKVNMRLCTQSFTQKENELLRNMLYIKFDIKSKVMVYKYKGKIYYHLTLKKEATQRLSDIVREYMPESMLYKIMPTSETKR